MNDKFAIEVTINPLVSPLLYERLCRCASARERAAVLRSLAEATLLRELLGYNPVSHPASGPASVTTSRLPTNEANMTESLETLRLGNAADIAQGLRTDLDSQLD